MPDFSADPEFSKLLSGRDDVNLIHLMLEVASDAYPNLDRLESLIEIDRLGVACERGAASRTAKRDIRESLAAISRVLFEIEGFHGNREQYYEPENSYLNEVLTRRCGIPISLGILYMGVAERVGLPMFGVNTPGHFVIGCRSRDEILFVDPFGGGDVLEREACKRRIAETLGKTDAVSDQDFRPASARQIAARMLRNLKAAYAMHDRWCEALPVQQRLTALLPQAPQEHRDLGLIYLRSGHPHKALPLLEKYVHEAGCGSDQAAALEGSLRAARKMVAELN